MITHQHRPGPGEGGAGGNCCRPRHLATLPRRRRATPEVSPRSSAAPRRHIAAVEQTAQRQRSLDYRRASLRAHGGELGAVSLIGVITDLSQPCLAAARQPLRVLIRAGGLRASRRVRLPQGRSVSGSIFFADGPEGRRTPALSYADRTEFRRRAWWCRSGVLWQCSICWYRRFAVSYPATGIQAPGGQLAG